MRFRLLITFGCFLVAASPHARAYEEVITPYETYDAGAMFSMAQIDPFEPRQRWGSEPRVTYDELLRRTSFIYRHYRSVLHFSEQEIRNLIRMDLRSNPGSFAYVSSREPRSDHYRGVLRIAATRDLRAFFGSVVSRGAVVALPMERKYARLGLSTYVQTHYPERVELGRFATEDPSPTRRIDTLTRLLRATALFLTGSFRDTTLLVESTPTTRELYEAYGFRVDASAPMPDGRFLMTTSRRELTELLVGHIERARLLPRSVSLYGADGAALALAQLDDAEQELPRLFRRVLGALPYWRALALANSGRAREALPHVDRLRLQYPDEPETLSLELHVRSLAHIDPWTGIGDSDGLLQWLGAPKTVQGYRTHDFHRYTSWNDRLYWEALTYTVAGRANEARERRDRLAEERGDDVPLERAMLDAIGKGQAETIGEESRSLAERLDHARHRYTMAPVGLSPTFNRFCAELLAASGDAALAETFVRRAETLEAPR